MVRFLADGKGEKITDTLPGEVDVAHFQVVILTYGHLAWQIQTIIMLLFMYEPLLVYSNMTLRCASEV
jgi:hypothetical protein